MKKIGFHRMKPSEGKAFSSMNWSRRQRDAQTPTEWMLFFLIWSDEKKQNGQPVKKVISWEIGSCPRWGLGNHTANGRKWGRILHSCHGGCLHRCDLWESPISSRSSIDVHSENLSHFTLRFTVEICLTSSTRWTIFQLFITSKTQHFFNNEWKQLFSVLNVVTPLNLLDSVKLLFCNIDDEIRIVHELFIGLFDCKPFVLDKLNIDLNSAILSPAKMIMWQFLLDIHNDMKFFFKNIIWKFGN